MKVVAFLVSLVLFLGSLLLFGYAFSAVRGWDYALFAFGVVGITLALVIPFHVLERLD